MLTVRCFRLAASKIHRLRVERGNSRNQTEIRGSLAVIFLSGGCTIPPVMDCIF